MEGNAHRVAAISGRVRSFAEMEECSVTTPAGAPGGTANIGFLTVLQEAGGYVGGYLVTNGWGRPFEFRVSSAVQPNKVQQILYGGTLEPYICGDLIGKALMDKAGVPVQLVVTDRESVLDLRLKLEAPILWLMPSADPRAATAPAEQVVCPSGGGRGPVVCHPRYPGDVSAARELLDRVDNALDLAEPFARIREAIGEARKLGATE
jgi:hypothetical protein